MGNTGSAPTGKNSLIRFHPNHGRNVLLQPGDVTAVRAHSFCDGICFTNRPLQVGEKWQLVVHSKSEQWSGVLRIGLTVHDPTVISSIPKYSCPDLQEAEGYWVKAVPEKFCEPGTVITLQVTRTGVMFISTTTETKQMFLIGVSTTKPFWGVIDVYGNTTSVSITSKRRGSLASDVHSDAFIQRQASITSNSSPSPQESPLPPPPLASSLTQIVDAARHLTSHHFTATSTCQFHSVTGRNVSLQSRSTLAVRSEGEFVNGYIFSSKCIKPREAVAVQVAAISADFQGGLTFGVTNCSLQEILSLPDDSDSLLDRGEYWVVNKDVVPQPNQGDELVFRLLDDGCLTLSKNNGLASTLMYVDSTLSLTFFWDMYGKVAALKSLGVASPGQVPLERVRASVQLPPRTSVMDTDELGLVLPPPLVPAPLSAGPTPPAPLSTQPVAPPPPVRRRVKPSVERAELDTLVITPPKQNFSATAAPISKTNPFADDFDVKAYQEMFREVDLPTIAAEDENARNITHEPDVRNECSICLAADVDCVFYPCGHMCACFSCASNFVKSKGPTCPMCRGDVVDVVKVFKS